MQRHAPASGMIVRLCLCEETNAKQAFENTSGRGNQEAATEQMLFDWLLGFGEDARFGFLIIIVAQCGKQVATIFGFITESFCAC